MERVIPSTFEEDLTKLVERVNLVSWFNIGEDMIVFINTKKANLGTKKLSIRKGSLFTEETTQTTDTLHHTLLR